MDEDKTQEEKFDLRTLDFYRQLGKITPKDYDQYLKSLPDEEGNYEEVVISEEEEPQPPSAGEETSD